MNVCRCFVALVDLLGFSSAVMAEDLSVPVAMVKRFQRITRSSVAHANTARMLHGLDRGRRSRVRVFSDLVLISTEGDSHDDCMDMLELSAKLFRLACENGVLPRGAIAWGEVAFGPSVAVGRPLVEAHRLESEQDWAGIALCDSMVEWDREEGLTMDRRSSVLRAAEETTWLVRWPVPTKSVTIDRLAVNWLLFDEWPLWHKVFMGGIGSVTDRGARHKLEHTQTFYEHLVQLATISRGPDSCGRLRRDKVEL